MTIFDAERLILAYRAAPVHSALAEQARIDRLIQTLRGGLPNESAEYLYRRLQGKDRGRHYGSHPIWDLLFELLDRRPALGIPEIEATDDYSYVKVPMHIDGN